MVAIIRLSGAALHQRALRTVIDAPLRFFTTTDAGIVTNLFSQDMTLIDGELPFAMVNLSLEVFQVIGMGAIIAASSPWIAVTYPMLVLILWVIQKFYLRTSRQLRLLDLEAKSSL
jgi:ABC-type multidrug transport system fused ATPase/permease subunit